MNVKRCLVVERGAVVGDYFNPRFGQSPLEVRKLLKALPMMTKLNESRRFDLLPRDPREEHFYYAFATPRSAFTLLLTLCGPGAVAPEAVFAPLRAFIAEGEGQAPGGQYALLTRFLHAHLARLQAEGAAEAKIDLLRQNLDAIKEKTRESFQKVISRGRDLTELGEEAATLSVEAQGFCCATQDLKSTLRRKRLRQRVLGALAVLGALIALYAFVF